MTNHLRRGSGGCQASTRGRRWCTAAGVALALLLAGCLQAADLRVAVAANFSGTLQRLAELYERGGGEHIVPSAGSSGQLYAQIRQGAPFDVFLSADSGKPQQLERDGLALPGSRCIYAIGTLVLWSPRPGLVDDGGKVLGSNRFRLLGIASPGSAPYGTAAREVLEHLGLWRELSAQRRIVTGENITQAWQFAASGSADLAFVALSQVLGPEGRIEGSAWLPPQDLYHPLEQAGIALAAGQGNAARAFLDWLRTDRGALATLHAAGYRTGG